MWILLCMFVRIIDSMFENSSSGWQICLVRFSGSYQIKGAN